MCAQLARVSIRDLLPGCPGAWLQQTLAIPQKSPSFRDPFSTQQIHAHSTPCAPKHWSQGLRRTQSVTDVPPLWEAKSQIIFTCSTLFEITKINAHLHDWMPSCCKAVSAVPRAVGQASAAAHSPCSKELPAWWLPERPHSRRLL